jgi:hypothetical protein
MYESILIDFVGLKKVYETSPNIPIVIIPTHKSYVDFLVISYGICEEYYTGRSVSYFVSILVCFAYRLPLPHIAAGDDFLNIMIVNWIFRHWYRIKRIKTAYCLPSFLVVRSSCVDRLMATRFIALSSPSTSRVSSSVDIPSSSSSKVTRQARRRM